MPDNESSGLSSWVIRHGFTHWGVGLFWLLTALLPMQFVLGILLFTIFFLTSDGTLFAETDLQSMAANLDILISFNSAWQVLILAAGTILMTRLHTAQKNISDFLRIRITSHLLVFTSAAVLLVITIQPLVWFLAYLNSFIPLPNILDQMQTDQMEIMNNLMQSDYSLVFILFNIAVVPAICEEILFRGYVMRTFEKHTAAVIAIIISSLLFGLFHLRITHFLPLSFIGVVLAFMTYGTNSLFPAMAAHFTNNALAIILSRYFPDSTFVTASTEVAPPMWSVLLSVGFSALIITFLLLRFRSAK